MEVLQIATMTRSQKIDYIEKEVSKIEEDFLTFKDGSDIFTHPSIPKQLLTLKRDKSDGRSYGLSNI